MARRRSPARRPKSTIEQVALRICRTLNRNCPCERGPSVCEAMERAAYSAAYRLLTAEQVNKLIAERASAADESVF